MSLKVLLVVLNIIIFGANTEGISENECLQVSTSQSPEEKNIYKISETISKIKENNRHFLVGLTQILEDNLEHINAQFELKKKLQLLEESNEEQQQSISRLEQSLEAKSQIVDQIQRKLDRQEKTIEEHQKGLPAMIEHILKEKDRKICEMQKKLDQLEKAMEEQQNSLSRIEPSLKLTNEKIVEIEANYKKIEQTFLPKSCNDIQKNGIHSSGVYLIRPKSKSFSVWCDMDTNGGGWSVVQKRFDGSEDFYRNWTDYKQGFGSELGEFWLGLQQIYELTAETQSNELLIILMDRNDTEAFAHYDSFNIGSEAESYFIKTLGTYSGTAGDCLLYHLGGNFSTWDRENSISNCSQAYQGGWWFKECLYSNLNGRYSEDGIAMGSGQGINWYMFSRDDYSLLKSKMMVRS